MWVLLCILCIFAKNKEYGNDSIGEKTKEHRFTSGNIEKVVYLFVPLDALLGQNQLLEPGILRYAQPLDVAQFALGCKRSGRKVGLFGDKHKKHCKK